jgi:TonB family protein
MQTRLSRNLPQIAERRRSSVRSPSIFFAALVPILIYSASAAEALGPISQYCRQVQAQLKKSAKPTPEFAKDAFVDIGVDTSGLILDVKASKFNNGSPAALEQGMAILKTVSKLDAPPAAAPKPLWLQVEFGDKLEGFDVNWRDTEYTQYMKNVQAKVKQCWSPATPEPSNHAELAFEIHDDGRMSDLQLATKSGISKVDQAALAAARKAAPFPPLPDGSSEHVFINFTLDYNVHVKSGR